VKFGSTLREAVAARRTEQAVYAAAETRPPSHVKLGPLTIAMMERARWQGTSAFPSSQLFADEIEKILNFAYWNGQFEHYLGHLSGTSSQRDSALAELRVAFFLCRNGFRISTWRPTGEGAREGEYSVRGPSAIDIFIEVKSPGWESELKPREIARGRQRQPKDLYCEARFVNPARALRFAIDKAYGKFANNIPNLLVIADDLFIGLGERPQEFAETPLYKAESGGYFATAKYERLGGVGIFSLRNSNTEVWYEMKLFLNPFAAACSLPADVAQGFQGYAPRRAEAEKVVVIAG